MGQLRFRGFRSWATGHFVHRYTVSQSIGGWGGCLCGGKTVGEGAAFSLLLPAHASLPFFHSMHEEGIILCKVLEGKDGGMGGRKQWSVVSDQ